jgi:hypothetical protein
MRHEKYYEHSHRAVQKSREVNPEQPALPPHAHAGLDLSSPSHMEPSGPILEHRGFTIQRNPDYGLWCVKKDGQGVTGLAGHYTQIELAQKSIDTWISDNEKANNKPSH